MDSIKVGYFADGVWAQMAFKEMAKNPGIEIAFVVPRNHHPDPVLRAYAKEHGIDFLSPVRVNSEDFRKKASGYGCDLFASVSFNQIFKRPLLDLPPLGVINYHAGKLPFYRGRCVLNWVLINDEDEFGVTVHYVDEGIDTGDIILQETYPIDDSDDYASLLRKADRACAELLPEAITQIRRGEAGRTPQSDIHPTGFYCGARGPGDERIDWSQSSRDIFNFIRALDEPGPVALSSCDGRELRIHKSRYIAEAPAYKGFPGQLLSETDRGFLVKTGDTFLEIYDIETDAELKRGDRLGNGWQL